MHSLKEIDQSSLVIFDMSVIFRDEACIMEDAIQLLGNFQYFLSCLIYLAIKFDILEVLCRSNMKIVI